MDLAGDPLFPHPLHHARDVVMLPDARTELFVNELGHSVQNLRSTFCSFCITNYFTANSQGGYLQESWVPGDPSAARRGQRRGRRTSPRHSAIPQARCSICIATPP